MPRSAKPWRRRPSPPPLAYCRRRPWRSATPALRAIVDDINIKRKAVYAEKAQAQHATVEEYAFTSGCLLIANTKPGEKYQAPDGSWQTRGAGAPLRDSRCP